MSVHKVPVKRYSNWMIIAHWSISILVAVHLVNAFTLHLLRDIETSLIFRELHRSFGLLILAATLGRLVLRYRSEIPPLKDGMPKWQITAAKFSHFMLYTLLLILPFMGWAHSNSIGAPVFLFWFIPMPEIAPFNVDTGLLLLDLHMYLSVLLLTIITLHICASFYNKYMLKNLVFEKILILKDSHLFTSYFPIWMRMSVASLVALGGCALIGYSGINSTNTIGKAYDQVFQSVVHIRSAQVEWEKIPSSVSRSELETKTEYHKKIKNIQAELAKATPHLDRSLTKMRVQKLGARINKLSVSVQTIDQMRASEEYKAEAGRISREFNRIIQEMAAIVYETRQNFETLSAKQQDGVVLTLVSVFCLCAIIIIFMTSSTSIQISKAAEFARQVAEGKISEPMRIRGHSETANLMKSLEHMRSSLLNQFNWIADRESDLFNNRQTTQKEITIFLDNKPLKTLTIDVSESGMCIKAQPGMSDGQKIEILNEYGVKKQALVVWKYNDMAGIQVIRDDEENLFASQA